MFALVVRVLMPSEIRRLNFCTAAHSCTACAVRTLIVVELGLDTKTSWQRVIADVGWFCRVVFGKLFPLQDSVLQLAEL